MCLSRNIWILLTILVVGLLIVVFANFTLTAKSHINNKIEPITEIASLGIIDRDAWLAMPPQRESDDLILPAQRVIILHTATDACSSTATCCFRVRHLQAAHMELLSFDDIGYNFLVGGDGLVYVGRGWDKQGAHTRGYNRGSIGIAFIGTFNFASPHEKQMIAAKKLIDEGVRLGKLSPDFCLYGARQLQATESPGKLLYNIIKMWPNWSNNTNCEKSETK